MDVPLHNVMVKVIPVLVDLKINVLNYVTSKIQQLLVHQIKILPEELFGILLITNMIMQ
jgi:hypothetical protein